MPKKCNQNIFSNEENIFTPEELDWREKAANAGHSDQSPFTQLFIL